MFTPKCLFQSKEEIYLFGYNHPDKCIEAVNLKEIKQVRKAFKHNIPDGDKIFKLLDEIDPKDYIAEEQKVIIYEGPIILYFAGPYVQEVYQRFGQASGPVEKDKRCRITYPIDHVVITTDTLLWLSKIPQNKIRIIGPDPLIDAISSYFDSFSKIMFHMKQ